MTEMIRIPVGATLGPENEATVITCAALGPENEATVITCIMFVPQDQLRGRNFTFWEWFYKHLDLIKTTLKREWMEG